jgi:hypothetical protein
MFVGDLALLRRRLLPPRSLSLFDDARARRTMDALPHTLSLLGACPSRSSTTDSQSARSSAAALSS